MGIILLRYSHRSSNNRPWTSGSCEMKIVHLNGLRSSQMGPGRVKQRRVSDSRTFPQLLELRVSVLTKFDLEKRFSYLHCHVVSVFCFKRKIILFHGISLNSEYTSSLHWNEFLTIFSTKHFDWRVFHWFCFLIFYQRLLENSLGLFWSLAKLILMLWSVSSHKN